MNTNRPIMKFSRILSFLCVVVFFAFGSGNLVKAFAAHTQHTYGEWKVTLEPTCVTPGKKERFCTQCSESQWQQINPTKVHQYGDWKKTTQETCVSSGKEERFCAYCSETQWRLINPTGVHTYGKWKTVVEATCTKDGKQERSCINCNGATESKTIKALGHSMGQWVTTNATCLKDGKSTSSCSRCSYKEEKILSAPGHSFGEWTTQTASTCQTKGVRVRICSVCKTKETGELPIGTHSYGEWKRTVEPTCVKSGKMERFCSVCSEPQYQLINPTGKHVYQKTYIKNNVTYGTCTICGNTEILSTQHVHSWSDWVTAFPASCVTPGIQTRYCIACGLNDSKSLPLIPHQFDREYVITEPTCFTPGAKERYCKICHKTEQVLIPAEHKFQKKHVSATCTTPEKFISHCSRCDYEIVEEGSKASGHIMKTKIIPSASCTESGTKIQHCTVCDYEKTERIPAPGHQMNQPELVSRATCAKAGLFRSTCKNCSYCAETRIKPLEHEWKVQEATVKSTGGKLQKKYKCQKCGLEEWRPLEMPNNCMTSQPVTTPSSPSAPNPRPADSSSKPCTNTIIGHGTPYIYVSSPNPITHHSSNHPNHVLELERVIKKADCTTAGKALFFCRFCAYEEEVTLIAPGHIAADRKQCDDSYICKTCGAYLGPGGMHDMVSDLLYDYSDPVFCQIVKKKCKNCEHTEIVSMKNHCYSLSESNAPQLICEKCKVYFGSAANGPTIIAKKIEETESTFIAHCSASLTFEQKYYAWCIFSDANKDFLAAYLELILPKQDTNPFSFIFPSSVDSIMEVIAKVLGYEDLKELYDDAKIINAYANYWNQIKAATQRGDYATVMDTTFEMLDHIPLKDLPTSKGLVTLKNDLRCMLTDFIDKQEKKVHSDTISQNSDSLLRYYSLDKLVRGERTYQELTQLVGNDAAIQFFSFLIYCKENNLTFSNADKLSDAFTNYINR